MEAMEHSEVRELLEDAAIEPGGLERLMAGDTPTASIVAGHLAGCADCSEELERLRRSVGLIRPTVQLVPPPELKERTLAYVAALGRPRGSAVDADPARAQAGAPIPSIATAAPAPISTRWRPGRPGWLASATGTPATGSLVYSPTSTELVVVAEHLTPAPAGHEYRCWVDVDGHRTGIGKMFFGGELAYWVGNVKSVAGLPSGARFGVSLVDLASTDQPGEVVLVSD